MKTYQLKNNEAEVHITELSDNKRLIEVKSDKFSLPVKDQRIETHYPIALIEKFLEVKGPRTMNDEIRREQDPLYTRKCLEPDILAYCSKDNFKNKRILDFGCGAGASSIILARMFPDAEIVGIDLSEKLLYLAKERAKFYQYDNISFYCNPDGKTLPKDLGNFDYIILSAVFEHLLPDERKTVLKIIWSMLKPDGIFFLNQTPYRFFPFEGHTTRLFFVNYLPDKLAYIYAKKFSKRVREGQTWQQLLRRGIRGGYPKQILEILKQSDKGFKPVLLKPQKNGLKDRVDVWYQGYAVSIADKYPKMRKIQSVLRIFAKVIYKISGIVFLPTVSVAIRKEEL